MSSGVRNALKAHGYRPAIVALLLVLAAGAITLGTAGASTPRAASSHVVTLLPDLRADPPFEVGTQTVQSGSQTVKQLTFGSMIDNIGRGPLIIDGHKSSSDTNPDDAMVASQALATTSGGVEANVVPNVGSIFFYYPHYHWHLLPFEVYELHKVGSDALVAPDHKAGFCLGDRYKITYDYVLPGEPVHNPPWGGGWSCDRPQTLSLSDPFLHIVSIREGISVGWGDDYVPVLEGQSIDITNVASGRYYLVNRVNPYRKLREADYSNDAASVLVQITASGGSSTVKVLAKCPLTARCDPSQRPLLVRRPTLSGAKVGSIAGCGTGSWKRSPDHFYYQWLSGGYVIPGATASTFRVPASKLGHKLSCQVTASNSHDDSVASSASVVVAPHH